MTTETMNANTATNQKNIWIAYLLWFFVGGLGAHRIYLGKIGSGLTQLALLIVGTITAFFGIGFVVLAILGVWWLLDAYFTQKIVSES